MELGFFGFLSLVFDRQPQAVMTTTSFLGKEIGFF